MVPVSQIGKRSLGKIQAPSVQAPSVRDGILSRQGQGSSSGSQRLLPEADIIIVAFLDIQGAQMTLSPEKKGVGESLAWWCLSFDISTLPFAEHIREKIIHMEHHQTEWFRSGAGFCNQGTIHPNGENDPAVAIDDI